MVTLHHNYGYANRKLLDAPEKWRNTTNMKLIDNKWVQVIFSTDDNISEIIITLLAALDLDAPNVPMEPCHDSLLYIEIHSIIDDDDDESEDVILDDDDGTASANA